MAKNDIASRVYNHTWKLDPIVRSLLVTDDLAFASQCQCHIFTY